MNGVALNIGQWVRDSESKEWSFPPTTMDPVNHPLFYHGRSRHCLSTSQISDICTTTRYGTLIKGLRLHPIGSFSKPLLGRTTILNSSGGSTNRKTSSPRCPRHTSGDVSPFRRSVDWRRTGIDERLQVTEGCWTGREYCEWCEIHPKERSNLKSILPMTTTNLPLSSENFFREY